MQKTAPQSWLQSEATLGLVFITVLSFFTIVFNFATPQHFFWDENYHIASAQKYLNGIFFMEPHPPLGKMIIALGEKVMHQNATNDQFIGTDYATNPPAGFSFTGYRLFPVLFAWLTAPILFLIFFRLTRRTLWSVLFSFLYVFDNALIVHLRSAVLEGPLLVFSCLTILAFLVLVERKEEKWPFIRAALLFGFGFAAVMTTKVFGLILVLLVPALFYFLKNERGQFLRFLLWSAVAFLPLYAGVWQMHFSIAAKINPALADQGYYQASAAYKNILTEKKTGSLSSFTVMLRDSLNFVGHYEDGVPRLNLCKKDENGSPWFLWPFGGRSINYRWETPDGQQYRYLYLQVNPVVWGLGLIGVVLAAILLIAEQTAGLQERLKNKEMLLTFLGTYIAYMIAIARITRVMYLYHYFIPLLLTFILFALVFEEIRHIGKRYLTEEGKTLILFILALLIFFGYQFFRPLTYYEPLTDSQFQRRSWLRIWELHCVHCSPDSPFVIPSETTK